MVKQINRILLKILFLNFFVASLQMFFGFLAGSIAMFADGIHSLTDGVSTIVALIAVKMSNKPIDKDHLYGHYKYETLGSMVIGMFLLYIAYSLSALNITKIINYFIYGEIPIYEITKYTFIVVFITFTVSIFVYFWESKKGKEFKSEILIADAKHTLSDVWTTIGIFFALIFTSLGYVIFDFLVTFLIAFIILLSAINIFKSAIKVLTDHIVLDNDDISKKVLSFKGVIDVKNIKNYGNVNNIFIEMTIIVSKDLNIVKVYEITNAIEKDFLKDKKIINVPIHVEPDIKTK